MFSVLQNKWVLILASVVCLVNVEQSEVITGWSTSVLTKLESSVPITSDQGWISTTVDCISFLWTPLSVLSFHYLGYKHTMALAVIVYIVSWAMIAFAKTAIHLIIAKGIIGFATSMTFIVSPIYLAEISPHNIRGGIVLCMSIVTNMGTLWIYFISIISELWLSSLLSALPLIVFLVFYKWLPKSPYFLNEKGKKEQAISELKRIRNSDNIESEIQVMESKILEKSDNTSLLEIFKQPHLRTLLICLGLLTFAQFTGKIIFLSHAHVIYQKAGNVNDNVMNIIQTILQLITSIISASIVDKVGRRPLLIVSCIGSSIFMACEGIYFCLLDQNYNVDSIWWLPITAMFLFNISQFIGLIPISLLYLGELFHPDVKSVAVWTCKDYVALTMFMVEYSLKFMTDTFGNSISFFVFSIIDLLGMIFVIFCVPETKGKTFEEIQYYLKHQTYDMDQKDVNNTRL